MKRDNEYNQKLAMLNRLVYLATGWQYSETQDLRNGLKGKWQSAYPAKISDRVLRKEFKISLNELDYNPALLNDEAFLRKLVLLTISLMGKDDYFLENGEYKPEPEPEKEIDMEKEPETFEELVNKYL